MTRSSDGRIAQGWGGRKPNACRAIVVLARRSGTAVAGLVTSLTRPADRLAPILVSAGPDHPFCETVQPPTLLVGHEVANTARSATLIGGACQVGVAQGVLDSVADGLLEPDQETLVFVSLWLDHDAEDETAVRWSAREAVGLAVREAVHGLPKDAARRLVEQRDNLTHPHYGGE
ncbi:MAG: formaldehyde-activating enzyme [Saccharopolyspora sp.]|uniref:formaldehyde-activating enzyme n=1 Tax=Saccharopolyspora sp. TaxID=33915 RepID=UPI0025CE92A3|nr:formaldehyde-activating enzyme [Saccharopolyspora sp.]MBQ6642658.1 formaldehyde-activating enzyme [Saccharopolyspora sp.]